MHCLNYSGQNSNKTICNLSFWHTCDFEIRSRSLNLESIARPRAMLQPCKVWKPPLNSVHQKADNKFLSSQKTHISLKCICAKVKNSDIFIISTLTYLTILKSLNLIKQEHKISVQNVQHCCDLVIQSRPLKMVWTDKRQWIAELLPLCKVSHLPHL